MSCEIYKFAQSANILTCSKLFTIGWSIVALMFQEFVMVINLVFKMFIMWLVGVDKIQVVVCQNKKVSVACQAWWVL